MHASQLISELEQNKVTKQKTYTYYTPVSQTKAEEDTSHLTSAGEAHPSFKSPHLGKSR